MDWQSDTSCASRAWWAKSITWLCIPSGMSVSRTTAFPSNILIPEQQRILFTLALAQTQQSFMVTGYHIYWAMPISQPLLVKAKKLQWSRFLDDKIFPHSFYSFLYFVLVSRSLSTFLSFTHGKWNFVLIWRCYNLNSCNRKYLFWMVSINFH